MCWCCAGNYFTYQLMLATTDLRLHTTYDPAGKLTASDVQQEQYRKIMVSGGTATHTAQRCQSVTHKHMCSSSVGPTGCHAVVTACAQPEGCCSCQAEHTGGEGAAACK